MNLNEWCNQAEDLRAWLGEEYWKMRIGVPYSEKKIKELEAQNGKHCEQFLKENTEPELIFIDALDAVSSARAVDATLKFEEERKNKIACQDHKHKGFSVNWTTWRQWAANAKDEDRKRVFDEFIEKTPAIAPLIEERFSSAMAVFEEHDTDPLKTFLAHHNLSAGQLRAIVEELRDATKPVFVKGFSEWCDELLSRKPEYYDDFYFMRNKIYEDVSSSFARVDSLSHCLSTMRAMGLDPSSIKLDDADRPQKYPSPFCSFIRVPTDVRVSFKKENPLNTAVSAYHEYGHAIHASGIDPNLPYWTRNIISMGLAESFSTFFEELIGNDHYCKTELRLSDHNASEIRKRVLFHNQFAVSFYCANSLFRIDTYTKKVPFDRWDDLYARHIKQCMGIDMPGEYWKLHHILPESLLYVPAYLLAFIRSHEMQANLSRQTGPSWWKSPLAGKQLKEWIKPGQDSSLGDFSRIDVRGFIKKIKGKNF